MTRLTFLALLILALVAIAWPTAPVGAAFPGVNGKIAFTSDRDGNWEIYVMNADGSAQTNLTNDPAADGGAAGPPSWSPDGSKIAFASDRTGNYEVYSMNADGSSLEQLTDDPAADGLPSWSPDGTQIAFASYRDGNTEIYRMDANGLHPRRLTSNGTGDFFPVWSPDGTRIAFHRTEQDPAICLPTCVLDVYAIDADGSHATQLTNNGASTFPDWSPDGSQIAYSFNDGNAPGIFVMNADGSNQHDLTPNTTQFESVPAWSPDGGSLAYEGAGDGGFDVFVMTAGGTGKTRLTNAFGNDSFPDWQPRLLGDVNCRNGANSVDAQLVLQLDARLLDALACADLADVNGDSRIDSEDADLILQYSARLIERLPVA